MKGNFLSALNMVLQSEGGFVINPHDPGGATNKGITQAVYDDWRKSQELPAQSVKNASPLETSLIYSKLYWLPIHGDDLPSGVDYATFDMAVNSGVNRASRFLQRAVGVTEDGVIGPATIAACKAVPPKNIINSLCAERAAFLKACLGFPTFGRGWLARVASVQLAAERMA